MLNTAASTISIAGRQLETLLIQSRTENSATVVMLHAGLSSMDLWHKFPAQLAERTGCSVLLYSRYGYGRSEVLHEKRDKLYLHHEAYEVLSQLLKKYEISRPVIFGHSDGASIALLYAAKFPKEPLGIVVEAPHVFVEEITIKGILEAKDAFNNGDLGRKLQPYHTDAQKTFLGWNDIWLDTDFRDWNIESEIQAIECPVLAIQGEDDQYGTLAQLDAIKAVTPNTELFVLPRCRHSPHSDRPEEVLAKSSDFIKSLTTNSQ
jgi:pimeloyl-ACP methyl ester carboxylesterase